MMDQTQQMLFGKFPRAVGWPNQFMVHSEGEFDAFTDSVMGRYNAYSTISWFEIDGTPWCDKVAYDLDSSMKEMAFPESDTDIDKIRKMRDSERLAYDVLGEVCEEARKLAEASRADGIPIVGVFSGFGLHIYQLFQPRREPAPELATTVRKYRDELGLATVDEQVVGDVERILRIPNMRRVYHDRDHPPFTRKETCPLFTVPLSGDELADLRLEQLMEWSRTPRPKAFSEPESRPEMEVYEDYTQANRNTEPAEVSKAVDAVDLDDEGVEWYLRELLKMPCMYENLLGDPEPPHEVRLNCAVLLFNIGMVPSEVADLMGQLDWRDWNREVTLKHLEHIYNKGYSDMNCTTIQEYGYCTRAEEPTDCDTYGWSGGESEW